MSEVPRYMVFPSVHGEGKCVKYGHVGFDHVLFLSRAGLLLGELRNSLRGGVYRVTSLIRECLLLGLYSRPVPGTLRWS